MIEACGSAVLVILLAMRLRPRPPIRVPASETEPPRSSIARRLRRPAFRRRPPSVPPHDVAIWCDLLAAELRTGATLIHAVRTTTAPPSLRDLVEAITLRLDRGKPLEEAVGIEAGAHLDVAIVALAACATHGGSAAEPLDRAAATLRARAADLGERQTQSAQARMSAQVMTVLPVAMLALVTMTSAPARHVLASSTGAIVIGVGVTLNLVGWRWMRRIIGHAT